MALDYLLTDGHKREAEGRDHEHCELLSDCSYQPTQDRATKGYKIKIMNQLMNESNFVCFRRAVRL